jgi:hypothetical protein
MVTASLLIILLVANGISAWTLWRTSTLTPQVTQDITHTVQEVQTITTHIDTQICDLCKASVTVWHHFADGSIFCTKCRPW